MQAAARLEEAYFLNDTHSNKVTKGFSPTFNDAEFKTRFRMPKEVFNRVKETITAHDSFFRERKNCTVKPSSSTYQKLVAALSQISHGFAAAFLRNELCMSELFIHECKKRFLTSICNCFSNEYLRLPTEDEITAIMERHSKLGFPGALGASDCSG